MADEHLIESAQAQQDLEIKNSIERIIRKSSEHIIPPIGYCYDCHEEFEKESKKKFCDSECQKSWDRWYQAQVRKYGPSFKPTPARD